MLLKLACPFASVLPLRAVCPLGCEVEATATPAIGVPSMPFTEMLMIKGCTVTCACPEPPRYPGFEAEAVTVHTVWVTVSGAVKLATYVPLPLSVTVEKVPPLLDTIFIVAPAMAVPSLVREALIVSVPPE